jgi:dienelactone hydrolase
MISSMVMVPADGTALAGDLVVPGPPRSVVVLAHGNGSSRHSPRNRTVAAELRRAGLGTLLVDLLSEREERADALTEAHRFDIPLLAGRLMAAVDWLGDQPDTAGAPVGLFGAGTGAAAALAAAAERPERVHAVVCRDGRPDLAGDVLERVRTPVLLVVGGNDAETLRVNREAAGRLSGPHKVHVVRGATHLLSEPEAMQQMTEAARDWFLEPAAAQPRSA